MQFLGLPGNIVYFLGLPGNIVYFQGLPGNIVYCLGLPGNIVVKTEGLTADGYDVTVKSEPVDVADFSAAGQIQVKENCC